MRLAVLASGTGSVLEAILEAGLPVSVVLVDRPCPATAVAASHGVTTSVVERDSFGPDFDRDAYTERVVDVLRRSHVDVVAMAGFGTVLSPRAHKEYGGRILNTHPALLPSFKGWHAVRDALAYGVKVTGCTVHVAGEEVDTGPILAQEAVPVLPGDSQTTLHERIKLVERRLYPDAIASFLHDLETLERTVSEPSGRR